MVAEFFAEETSGCSARLPVDLVRATSEKEKV